MSYDLQLRQHIAQTSTRLLRQHIAQISARLMVQEGITDFHQAKRKAAMQLGIANSKKHLPSNGEIEAELSLYQRLFHANSHNLKLYQQRQVALQTMRLLVHFTPRLVGAVLHGTAVANSDVVLHLFTHSPEDVAFFLMDRGIPYEVTERRFRLPQVVSYPSYQFVAGEEKVVLVIFGIDDIRWSPPSPIDGKPMRRADVLAVERLLLEGINSIG
jgi:hypothetical protein